LQPVESVHQATSAWKPLQSPYGAIPVATLRTKPARRPQWLPLQSPYGAIPVATTSW